MKLFAKQNQNRTYYEIAFTLLLILNALLLVYFINKLNHLSSIALDTQAKTQTLLEQNPL